MESVYHLLNCFAERYIEVEEEEAVFDARFHRDGLIGSFNAIRDYVRTLIEQN